jgi:hypothetical protein
MDSTWLFRLSLRQPELPRSPQVCVMFIVMSDSRENQVVRSNVKVFLANNSYLGGFSFLFSVLIHTSLTPLFIVACHVSHLIELAGPSSCLPCLKQPIY